MEKVPRKPVSARAVLNNIIIISHCCILARQMLSRGTRERKDEALKGIRGGGASVSIDLFHGLLSNGIE